MYAGRIVETATTDELFCCAGAIRTRGFAGSRAAAARWRPDATRRDPGRSATALRTSAGVRICPAMRARGGYLQRVAPGADAVRRPQPGQRRAGRIEHFACCGRRADHRGRLPSAVARTGGVRMSAASPLLQVERASVRYTLRGAGLFAPARTLDALCDVSIAIREGGRLGVVGESGSGKSTLARVVLGLVRARAGRVAWEGRTVDYGDATAMRSLRRELQWSSRTVRQPRSTHDGGAGGRRGIAGAGRSSCVRRSAGPHPYGIVGGRARVGVCQPLPTK